jgi:AcrR family transcriptional regulator
VATTSIPTESVDISRTPGRPRDERATKAITEAALHQLADIGYGKLTMESVACEAGVSRATIYRRFRDKADLVTAAIATNLTLPDRPSTDPRQDLIKYLKEFDARFAESCLEVLGCLVGSREEPGSMALHRERVILPRIAYARSLLEQAQTRGELRSDADLDLVLEMLTGAVFYRRVSGMSSSPDWAETAVGMVFDALQPSIRGPRT